MARTRRVLGCLAAAIAITGCSDARTRGDAGATDSGAGADGGRADAGADAGPADAGMDGGRAAAPPVTIAEGLSEVLSTDVVLDASGAAHVVFAEAGRITYLSEPGGWAPEVVAGATLRGAVHLAEQDGAVFVAVIESTPDAVTVVYERGTGSWAREVVYNGDVSSTSAPIVRRPSGLFLTWGAWQSGSSGAESHLVFCAHEAGAWGSTRFLTRGRPHSAAVDSRGLMHAAFMTDALGGSSLSTIREQGPTWIIYGVGSIAAEANAQLALDDDDRPHLFFRDFDTGELVYAHSPSAGADFELTSIEPSESAPVGLAVDPDGQPVLAYRRSSSAELVVARKDGDAFVGEVLEAEGDVGRALSVTMDEGGRLHVVHYDATRQRLRYAIR